MKILSSGQLKSVREKIQAEGGTLVFVSGVFDLLHPGHICFLEEAARHGTHLIVGVDASVNAVTPVADRCEILAALHMVDNVIEFDGMLENILAEIQPHVVVTTREVGSIANSSAKLVTVRRLTEFDTASLVKKIVSLPS